MTLFSNDVLELGQHWEKNRGVLCCKPLTYIRAALKVRVERKFIHSDDIYRPSVFCGIQEMSTVAHTQLTSRSLINALETVESIFCFTQDGHSIPWNIPQMQQDSVTLHTKVLDAVACAQLKHVPRDVEWNYRSICLLYISTATLCFALQFIWIARRLVPFEKSMDDSDLCNCLTAVFTGPHFDFHFVPVQ